MATTFLDSVGGQTLTATGTVNEVSGTFSGAEIVSGGSLSAAASASFNFAGSFTMALWLKVVEPAASGTIFAARYDDGSDIKFRLKCEMSPDTNTWQVWDGSDALVEVDITTPWPDGVWQLCVCYYDAANNLTGYSLNGAAYQTAAIVGVSDVPAGSLKITDSGSECTSVQFSMCAFWTRVLSAAEVTALYNEGTFPIKYPFA